MEYNCLLHLEEISNKLGTCDQIAVIEDNISLTYNQLYTKAKQFGSGLLESNICFQDHIILCSDDSIGFIICFLGCLYIGAIPILINGTMSKKDIGDIINKTHVNNLICL